MKLFKKKTSIEYANDLRMSLFAIATLSIVELNAWMFPKHSALETLHMVIVIQAIFAMYYFGRSLFAPNVIDDDYQPSQTED